MLLCIVSYARWLPVENRFFFVFQPVLSASCWTFAYNANSAELLRCQRFVNLFSQEHRTHRQNRLLFGRTRSVLLLSMELNAIKLFGHWFCFIFCLPDFFISLFSVCVCALTEARSVADFWLLSHSVACICSGSLSLFSVVYVRLSEMFTSH